MQCAKRFKSIKFPNALPPKNLQFLMNTVGPYGSSGGERVKADFHSVEFSDRRLRKDGGKELLPRCTAFFNRIPTESLRIRN